LIVDFGVDPEEAPSPPVNYSNSPPHVIYSAEKVRELPTPANAASAMQSAAPRSLFMFSHRAS